MRVEEIRTVRYKNDGEMRRRLMTPESYAHPAKGHLGLWEDIILRYTREGETVCDPMSGVGSTLLAALMGRNVICNELESHFVAMLRANWEKMRQHPMLGYQMGNVTIMQGDARNLSGLLTDAIVTSPPYEAAITDHDESPSATSKFDPRGVKPRHGYTQPAAIVTSPPYDQTFSSQGGPIDWSKTKRDGDTSKWKSRINTNITTYSAAATNIGNERGQKYWASMEAVYSECFKVLRPGGLMCLVVKGFTRDGVYQDLPTDTLNLCKRLGFVEHDRWRRELWSLSFWRVLQKRKSPDTFDDRLNYEEVVVVRKSQEHNPCV